MTLDKWLTTYYGSSFNEAVSKQSLKEFLKRPLCPNVSSLDDCDERPISREMYDLLWDRNISKFRGDTVFSPKGGWKNSSLNDGNGIVYSSEVQKLNVVYQEFLQEKSRQRSDEARTGWFDDDFKPPQKSSNSSKVSEPRFEAWKRYHCLANFMPLPSELNRWRGYMFKGYPSNGWRDRIDKFLSWVSFGYEEQADEYLLNSQRVFCLYKKHYFDYFGSFEAFLELNYLPNIRDIEEYKEYKGIVTLLDTMDAFLDYRADKMADGLLTLSKGQLH